MAFLTVHTHTCFRIQIWLIDFWWTQPPSTHSHLGKPPLHNQRNHGAPTCHTTVARTQYGVWLLLYLALLKLATVCSTKWIQYKKRTQNVAMGICINMKQIQPCNFKVSLVTKPLEIQALYQTFNIKLTETTNYQVLCMLFSMTLISWYTKIYTVDKNEILRLFQVSREFFAGIQIWSPILYHYP